MAAKRTLRDREDFLDSDPNQQDEPRNQVREKTSRYDHERSKSYACSDKDFSQEEMEYLNAMEAFKARTGRRFPTWTDALHVARMLGYAKTAVSDEPPEESSVLSWA